MVREDSGKRKYPRKSFRKTVSLICDGHAIAGQGIEIGEGGLSFSANVKMEPSKKMIVNFFLNEKDFFSVRMTLLNAQNLAKGFNYGAKFDDVSIALKRQIRAYVARTAINT